jgi:hypothetical protein
MDSNTKKILLYSGGAILVGSIAFFVYSFFKKDKITLANTDFILGDETEKDKPSSSVDNFKPKDVRFTPSDFSGGIGFTPSLLK